MTKGKIVFITDMNFAAGGQNVLVKEYFPLVVLIIHKHVVR